MKKNFEFFDQNRGFTLLENWDFWPYERFPFLWSKKVSFFLEDQGTHLLAYFDKKLNFCLDCWT